MLSFGELVVIVAAAAWVFGPNELPRVARVAGRFTGQATGFLYRTRARLFQLAEETEMTKLHAEVQATMYQLNAIRSELQGGINLFQPGPVAQRVMGIKPVPGQAGLGGDPLTAHSPWPAAADPAATAAATAAGPAGPAAAQGPALQPHQAPPAALGSFAAGAAMQAAAQQPAAAAAAAKGPLRPPRPPAPPAGEDGELHPLTIQVSAVAAGWAPDRSGGTPTGSEVLLDALAEELVAAQVLRFRRAQLAQQAQAAAAPRQAASAQQQQQQQQAGDPPPQRPGVPATPGPQGS